jgi:3-isopropylmalate/(R)-2-methylmalate dehydratase large subunit
VNLIEKILARESGKRSVQPGDVVVVDVELALLHDLSARSARKVFEEKVGGDIAHPERITVVFDHLFSPPSEDRAEVLRATRVFCRQYGIPLYDCGNGNLHQVAAQAGLIRPGALVVGSDSHAPVHGALGTFSAWLGNDSYAATVMPFSRAWFRVPETVAIELVGDTPPGTTARDVALWLTAQIGEGTMNYQAVKFHGEYVRNLSFWDRWLLTLMAVDVGAKCVYIEPDQTTADFAASVGVTDYEFVTDDPGTEFADSWRYDVTGLPPQIAAPPTVGNVHPVADYAGVRLDWAELGGHGGGRLDDVLAAASVLGAHPKHQETNFNVVPGSRHVFSEALRLGAVGTLHENGATWFPPSTGGNQAVNMGAMAEGETMISTHVRNFPGRNGSPKASMYLASALTVAASAANGKITDPREML